MAELSLEALRKAVADDVVAIRGRAILEPAGGPSDKVFPPTHHVDEPRPKSRYAFERRRIDGKEVDCVLLDSVQSQANRMEEALHSLWVDRRIVLPVVTVDFAESAPDIGRVTSLTAPHRIADALLRDSLLDGQLFRTSELGRSFADANLRNAAPLFKVCPTGLVFGIWDSTGPKRALGAKFARALVSEIVGIGATPGVKTSSRIDPAGIVTKAAEIYRAKDPAEQWTLDPASAVTEKVEKTKGDAKPVKFGAGRVSEVNHSNIPPTIDEFAGGVTIDHAEHVVVLSLATLRKLQFGAGDVEARTALAALGLLAILAAQSRGHDLRSRCLLVPRRGNALRLEMVRRTGETEDIQLGFEAAVTLYEAAITALPAALQFTKPPGEPLAMLHPSPKLVRLVQESRKLAATSEDIDES